MAKLEDLKKGASDEGVLPNIPVTVVDVRWHGSNVVELTYRDAGGTLGSELIFRDREPSLTITAPGTPWAFDSDGELFRLVSEAIPGQPDTLIRSCEATTLFRNAKAAKGFADMA